MADIRCPNCGKNNPDFLEVCQFCQTPLKPESVLRMGENPTKKNTGELEPILPDWLKDVRQQARTAAEEEAAAQSASHRRDQKVEQPDLLAGLASQGGRGDEEDVPDWLASLSPAVKPEPSAASTPDPIREPPQEEAPAWMGGMKEESQPAPERDELSEWFAQASGQTQEAPGSKAPPENMDWGTEFESPAVPAEEPAPAEPEDLSWLHNLEAAARQTGDLQAPKSEREWRSDFETPVPSQPAATPDDLSWLDRLGGIEAPTQQASEPAASSQDDLSWLNQFSGTSDVPQPSTPAVPQEDLSWLNDLGASPEPQPVDAAPNQLIPPRPFPSEEGLDWLNQPGGPSESIQTEQPSPGFEDRQTSEDLSWLNDLGKRSSSAEPPPAPEDVSWLNSLGGQPEPFTVPPFAGMDSDEDKAPPRHTAPLGKETADETEPDWLKRATEAPSMPAPGDLDWFSGQPTSQKPPPVTPQAAPFEGDIFSTPAETPSLSNQDVDSLFSMEMPDWLSSAEPARESVSQQAGVAPAEGDESLAPVELPSWVQAMRPVEAVISETASRAADQSAETEGPLAGLHGVIPIAPIGSPRRPKPVSLTLRASAEQQASALLLEEILGTETSPRTFVTSTVVSSQQWLRWALTALFLLALSAVILLGSQMMPVTAALPEEAGGLRSALMGIPANARLLVVIDYEPSLAGEMEAISSPLLDQLVSLNQPNLSFISTSPNGAALVERLMTNAGLAGTPYLNLGYLPGGSVGVLGFIGAPGQIVPTAGVGSFSEYSGVIVLTDHAESGRVWVEQLQNRKQADLALSNQPLLMVASAQAAPLLEPYVTSQQVTGLIGGISGAARYESLNNGRPGIARSYWDTFGVGLMLSVAVIVIGSLWSLFTGMRARRANAEQG